ncbi:2OG-Fe(II) oxygenase family oxidoreductase, putative (macronuclear) [Tetrahymena thermophila SB210]|uniref:2OG-Fe(II) oxygenase family oxidoreductase, putative n=1 Tax=Tetrahymena thermophila (strain SB210) TaxID=312017 RepID=Q22UT9_TETTS|nr:2OG-Fe(II) oxygenase family oxidoreductase, putative [Tetrahymena thermophila SB210]EAR89037.2 2OG-Fe(II) oxygenase family oxidoreductase, putative [Tetrahymena thermophila SB210]|eukprot:XP_001009282.2 2OG-Fe(II) oxygenase family oxidoreductase, putative [Tetrahymena thermophila SB210]
MYSKSVVQTAQKKSIIDIFKSEDKDLSKKKQLEQVVQGEIWVVKKFLSTKQCQEVIKFSESQGFQDALVNVGYGLGVLDKDFRDCNRVMIDDVETAQYLAEKLRPYVPLCQEGALYHGMNERFRILKYSKDQKFAMHQDGCWSPSKSIFSILTIQFYLNTVDNGGFTRFEWEGWESNEYKCKSEEGKIVIFRQQGWWHEGSHVLKGLKYTVRNDLMFKLYTQKEWEQQKQLHDLTCGVCSKKVKAEVLQCGHLFLFCGCHAFYNGDIHTNPEEKKRLRSCCQCVKKIQSPSKELYEIL